MNSNLPNAEPEIYDTQEELEIKIKTLVNLIKNSKHFVAFTGAGISTGAGIPDFYGKDGVRVKNENRDSTPKDHRSVMNKAFPTDCHMSLLKLLETGHLKFIISQNTDGLHRKSGVLQNQIAELHGNNNLESCEECGKSYFRDFPARKQNAKNAHDHMTGRKCDDLNCQGDLYDSIINFGENLPEKQLQNAYIHSKKSDLMLCLGSSLRVSPANTMPLYTKNKGSVVIVNLQKTEKDYMANLIIHAKIDEVMRMMMKQLELEIPTWIVRRKFFVQIEDEKNERQKLKVWGVDDEGGHFTIFKKLRILNDIQIITLDKEPFEFEKKRI